MKSVRGEKVFKILQTIGDRSINLDDLIVGCICAGPYPTSKKINYEAHLARKRRVVKADEKIKKIKIQQLLYYLKNDGLIKNESALLSLTERGLEKLKKFRKSLFLNTKTNYSDQKIKDDFHKIIIFDIPERVKEKREWLRTALKSLDFEMVQKSVWLGNNKLPLEFIKQLRDLQLVPHIKIFSVAKEGNLFF